MVRVMLSRGLCESVSCYVKQEATFRVAYIRNKADVLPSKSPQSEAVSTRRGRGQMDQISNSGRRGWLWSSIDHSVDHPSWRRLPSDL